MFSPRMVENFFKRTKFRRSRGRLRSSFRTSLIKKNAAAAAAVAAASAGSATGTTGPGSGATASLKQNGGSTSGSVSPTVSLSAIKGTVVSSLSDEDSASAQTTTADSECKTGTARQRPAATSVIGSSRATGCAVDLTNKIVSVGGAEATDAAVARRPRPNLIASRTSQPTSSTTMLRRQPTLEDCYPDDELSSPEARRVNSAAVNSHRTQHRQPMSPATAARGSLTPAGSLPVLCAGASDPSVVSLRNEVDALKKDLARSRDIIGKMQEREKQLRERLSEQAQRQLERGASKFEDISLGENRPTQLVKRYGNLYSEGRLDAMDALDELPEMSGSDDLKVKLLLSIVVLAFRSAQRTLLEAKTKIRELLHIPDVLHGGSSAAVHLVQEVEDTIAIYLRKTVDKHNVNKNFEEVCERVWETLYDYPALRSCAGLLHYVNDCVHLAWALTLQNPPLVVDYESRRFDPNFHVRFHTSDPDSADIKSVLWPVLIEGDGGACVYRGVVVT